MGKNAFLKGKKYTSKGLFLPVVKHHKYNRECMYNYRDQNNNT